MSQYCLFIQKSFSQRPSVTRIAEGSDSSSSDDDSDDDADQTEQSHLEIKPGKFGASGAAGATSSTKTVIKKSGRKHLIEYPTSKPGVGTSPTADVERVSRRYSSPLI